MKKQASGTRIAKVIRQETIGVQRPGWSARQERWVTTAAREPRNACVDGGLKVVAPLTAKGPGHTARAFLFFRKNVLTC